MAKNTKLAVAIDQDKNRKQAQELTPEQQLERLRERKRIHDESTMGFYNDELKASTRWLENFKTKPLTNSLLGWEVGDLIRHNHVIETMTRCVEILTEEPHRVESYTRNFYARLVRSLVGGSWASNTSLDTKVLVNKYESMEQGNWCQQLEYIVKTYENLNADIATFKEKYPELSQDLEVTKAE